MGDVAVDLGLGDVQEGEDVGEGDPGTGVPAGAGPRRGSHVIRQAEGSQQEGVEAGLGRVEVVVGQALAGDEVGHAGGLALDRVDTACDPQACGADGDVHGDVVDVLAGDRSKHCVAAESVLD